MSIQGVGTCDDGRPGGRSMSIQGVGTFDEGRPGGRSMSIEGVGTFDEGRPGTGLRQEYDHTGGGYI